MEILLSKKTRIFLIYTSSYVEGFPSQTVKGSTIQQVSWKKKHWKKRCFCFPHVPKHRTKKFRRNSKLLTVLEAQQLFAFPMGDVGLALFTRFLGLKGSCEGGRKTGGLVQMTFRLPIWMIFGFQWLPSKTPNPGLSFVFIIRFFWGRLFSWGGGERCLWGGVFTPLEIPKSSSFLENVNHNNSTFASEIPFSESISYK